MPDYDKECFVVCAIGGDGSSERKHADWVLEEIIEPVFERDFAEFKVTRADKLKTPGLIDAQIIDRLLRAKLVIADLTFLNPNAFYEIGIRHVVGLPVVHMHREDQRIPFDVSLFRSLPFDLSEPKQLKAARAGLKDLVTAALDETHKVENPVTKARGQVAFEQNASPADVIVRDQIQVLAREVMAIKDRMNQAFHPGLFDRFTVKRDSSTGRFHAGDPVADGVALGVYFRDSSRRDTHELFQYVENRLQPITGGFSLVENNENNLLIQVPLAGISEEVLDNLNRDAKPRGIVVKPA